MDNKCNFAGAGAACTQVVDFHKNAFYLWGDLNRMGSKITYIITIVVFWANSFVGIAQDKQFPDSITSNPFHLIRLAQNSKANPERMLQLSTRALNILENGNDHVALAKAYQLVGESYFYLNSTGNSIEALEKSVELYKSSPDSVELARTYNIMGICYQRRGKYSENLEHLQRALAIKERLNDSASLAATLNNLGVNYRLVGQPEMALKYYMRCEAIYRKVGNLKHLSSIQNNIGLIFIDLEKYQDALVWFNEALTTKLELRDTATLAITYDNLGRVHTKIGNYHKALEYYTLSERLYRALNDRHGIALGLTQMASMQIKTGKFKDAFENVTNGQSIARADGDNEILKESYRVLSDYYLQTGDLYKSRQMMAEYAKMIEKTFTEKTTREIADLTIRYEAEQKERDNKLLQANLEIERINLKHSIKSQILYSILSILLFILLVGSFLVILRARRKNQEIKRVNRQLSDMNSQLEQIVNNRTIQLTNALRKAEESDRLKSAFLSNLSHEIRTPMNGILGFAKLLSDDNLSQVERKHYLEIIARQGNNLIQIINDIISISKIEAGQMEFTYTSFNVNQLLSELFTMFSSESYSLKKEHVELKLVKSLGDRQAVIFTDPARLEQVFMNLLDNAFKFTDSGAIEFGYTLEKPNLIEFFVRDTGIGIPPEEQSRVFDRFYKHTPATRVVNGGTGLGLTISQEIVRHLGGEIKLESEVDRGSTFYFALPYVSTGISPSEKGTSAKKLKWKGKVILVVEDDLINYQYIEALLSKTGVQLIHVKNGEDAVEVCHIHDDISLVLMDIQLPFMNGLDAARKIKDFRRNLPIVAQTANAFTTDKWQCLEAGCDAYIAKPIDPDELMSLISSKL